MYVNSAETETKITESLILQVKTSFHHSASSKSLLITEMECKSNNSNLVIHPFITILPYVK